MSIHSMTLAIACSLGCAAVAGAKDWKSTLAENGLRYSGKQAYTVELDRAWSLRSHRIVGKAGEIKARVTAERVEDERQAERKFAEWRLWVYGPFQGDAAYPGMVTKKFEAPPELRPQEKATKEGGRKVLLVPATERLTFGAGAGDLAPRRAVVSFRYCPKARVAAQVELFWTAQGFREDAALEEEAAYGCAGR